MPWLPTDATRSNSNSLSGHVRRLSKLVMRSHSLHIPKWDLPLKFRPWFVVLTFATMLLMAFLGFTNFSHALFVNDKILHFVCFGIATALVYFILDVKEEYRIIWYWRHTSLIFTSFICLICGGVLSEFVQALLPFKEFQFGDIVANLLGASLGLFVAHRLERSYRKRREISRLYQPLATDYLQSDEEDEADDLLPRHYRPTEGLVPKPTPANGSHPDSAARLGDVWDEREELFDIGGGESDVEGEAQHPVPQAHPHGPAMTTAET